MQRITAILIVAVVTVLTACTDNITQPREADPEEGPLSSVQTSGVGDVSTQSCEGNAEDGYVCSPLEGGGGEPTCDEQARTDCDGGGDGGGGGGGSDGGDGNTPADPGTGTGTPGSALNFGDDDLQGATPPDCSKQQTLLWQISYCKGQPANGSQVTSTQQALNAIRSRGGECANIAAHGDQFLASGMIRYFPSTSSQFRGWGAPGVGVIIDERVIGLTGTYDLEYFLVHEIEHAMGRGHGPKDANGVDTTPNQAACS